MRPPFWATSSRRAASRSNKRTTLCWQKNGSVSATATQRGNTQLKRPEQRNAGGSQPHRKTYRSDQVLSGQPATRHRLCGRVLKNRAHVRFLAAANQTLPNGLEHKAATLI